MDITYTAHMQVNVSQALAIKGLKYALEKIQVGRNSPLRLLKIDPQRMKHRLCLSKAKVYAPLF